MQLRSRKIQGNVSEDEEDPNVSCTRHKNMKDLYEWKPSKDNSVLSFCRDSTLHGVHYIGDLKTHICERLFWVVALIILASVSFKFIADIFEKYNEDPIIVSYQPEELFLDQIPFPAITICSNNHLRMSAFKRVQKDYLEAKEGSVERHDAEKLLQMVIHFCKNYPQAFSTKFGYSVINISSHSQYQNDYYFKDRFANISEETLKRISAVQVTQPCSDLILRCLWRNKHLNCSRLFQSIETDTGHCCQFNGMPLEILIPRLKVTLNSSLHYDSKTVLRWKKWNIEENFIHTSRKVEHFYMPPMRQKKAGKDAALSLLLNPELDEHYWSVQDSGGFTLLAGSPIDFPEMAGFGVGIGPNSETFVDVNPELTMADPNIFALSVDKRHCYFHGELNLKYFAYYTVRNCRNECVTNITLGRCGCVRIYMAKNANTKICGEINQTCAHDVQRKLKRKGFVDKCTKKCLPSCTTIDYSLRLSKLPLNPHKNIWIKNNSESEPWADKNTSIVHIYFGSDTIYSKYRQRVYDESWLISNAGGLLSLYLGFSIVFNYVSLLEIIYHFILKVLFEQVEDETYTILQKWKAFKAKIRARCSRPRQTQTENFSDADTILRIFVKSKGNGYPWSIGELHNS